LSVFLTTKFAGLLKKKGIILERDFEIDINRYYRRPSDGLVVKVVKFSKERENLVYQYLAEDKITIKNGTTSLYDFGFWEKTEHDDFPGTLNPKLPEEFFYNWGIRRSLDLKRMVDNIEKEIVRLKGIKADMEKHSIKL
jgi:hypothetical protein